MKQTRQPADEIITAKELSRRSGVSVVTIYNLSKNRMIPQPVSREDPRNPLYNLGDPALADWLRRLQASDYGR